MQASDTQSNVRVSQTLVKGKPELYAYVWFSTSRALERRKKTADEMKGKKREEMSFLMMGRRAPSHVMCEVLHLLFCLTAIQIYSLLQLCLHLSQVLLQNFHSAPQNVLNNLVS